MSHRNGQHDNGNRFEDSNGRRAKRIRGEQPANPEGQESRNGKPPPPKEGTGAPGNTDSPRLPKLSEISHLFLSELRSASGQGRSPPKRTPPAAQASPPTSQPVDLNLDEVDEVDQADYAIPPLSAVIGARLGGQLARRACQYAAGLADELPVGVVIVEPHCARLMWVEQGRCAEQELDSPETIDDPERLRAALQELSCDVARWVVVLPDPRLPQARRLLAGIRDWVLLVAADHEGVVSGYRVLKGLCDLELPDDATESPHVTIAFVDAADAAHAQRHANRLVGVCRQFLDLEVDTADLRASPTAGPVSSVGEFTAHEVVCAAWGRADASERSMLEKVLLPSTANDARVIRKHRMGTCHHPAAAAATGSVTRTPVGAAAGIPADAIPPLARPAPASGFHADDWVSASEDLVRLERRLEPPAPLRRHIDDFEIPDLALPQGAVRAAGGSAEPLHSTWPPRSIIEGTGTTVGTRLPSSPAPALPLRDNEPPVAPLSSRESDEVIELPAGGSVADVVLARLELAETAIEPPMLASAKLCVSREGSIVLVAAASPGLDELPAVGRAMTWASENRVLLRMALSQYRVDDLRHVLLHLLVSRADVNADALRPLLSTGRVTVQAYRRLTWGGRSGLLLEAA